MNNTTLNKILIGVIVFLLLIMGIGAFHMHNAFRGGHDGIMDEGYNNTRGSHDGIMDEGYNNTRGGHDGMMHEGYDNSIGGHDGMMDEGYNNTRGSHEGMIGEGHNGISSNGIPIMPGQEAFGTIQEIINILDRDPKTDWSKVSIDKLREHLIDMDQLTMYSNAKRENITGGLKMTVTGTGRVLDAINRMVPTHNRVTLSSFKKWNTTLKNISNGVILTVTSSNNNKEEVNKIRGLGFIGIMAIGSKHPLHHLMMAKGIIMK